jgi:hypothetical protein
VMGRRMLLEHSTLVPVRDLLAKELEDPNCRGGDSTREIEEVDLAAAGRVACSFE